MDVQLAGRRMCETPSMHTAFALTPLPDEAAAALAGSAALLQARLDARQGVLPAEEAAEGDRCSDGGDVWLLSEPKLAREMLLALEVTLHLPDFVCVGLGAQPLVTLHSHRRSFPPSVGPMRTWHAVTGKLLIKY